MELGLAAAATLEQVGKENKVVPSSLVWGLVAWWALAGVRALSF
jgi:hypothetical protein